MKTEKYNEKYRKFNFSLFVFLLLFTGFSFDVYKGRISPNTIQIPLEAPQILPLWNSVVFTPESFLGFKDLDLGLLA